MFIYQNADYPNFFWDKDLIDSLLKEAKLKQGCLLGKIDSLGFNFKQNAFFEVLVEETAKSNEIEGEILDMAQLRSSIAQKFGIESEVKIEAARNIDGIADLMFEALNNYNQPLTKIRLCGWQNSIFPSGFSGLYKIKTGAFRDDLRGVMQVVSGAIGAQKVHYQAPPAQNIDKEIDCLIDYFNNGKDGIDLIIKAAVVHLWFVIIHPFEDGNGRLARVLSDMLLARSENMRERFYSISAQILKERKSYYEILEIVCRGSLDITLWLKWFLENFMKALDNAQILLKTILFKTAFWNANKKIAFNERQKKILNLLLEGSFVGNLTAAKWAKISKTSQETAAKDIADLIEKGILFKEGAARPHYKIKEN
jgi:Fic family protein